MTAHGYGAYRGGEERDRLVLVARAVVAEPPEDRASDVVIEQIRRHHLRLESLLAEQIGGQDDAEGWDMTIGYRGDSVVVAVAADRLDELVAVAWRMVESADAAADDDGSQPRTIVGISKQRVADTSGFRPTVPDWWPRSVDLQGIAVERSFSLVHDIGGPDQILICGSLVDRVDLKRVESIVDPDEPANPDWMPTKAKARVLRSDVDQIRIAQLSWNAAGPGTLTNRRAVSREVKALQGAVNRLTEFMTDLGGEASAVCAGPEGNGRVRGMHALVENQLGRHVKELRRAWEDCPETRESTEPLEHETAGSREGSEAPGAVGQTEREAELDVVHRCRDLKEVIEQFENDGYPQFAQRYRALRAVLDDEDSDTGDHSKARSRLQDAWQDCRDYPGRMSEAIGQLLDEVYA